MKIFSEFYKDYLNRLSTALESVDLNKLYMLATDLEKCREDKSQIFLVGNGGSAGNAMHIENDFLFGARSFNGIGLRIHALSSNPSVITCLGNDLGYEEIYSYQLKTYANKGDILIVLSGSGNSANVIRALEEASLLGMRTHAIVGFDGGKASRLANNVIHVNKSDMQIAEDAQIVLLHVLMQKMGSCNC